MAEDEVTYDEDEAYLAVTLTISLATKPSTAAGASAGEARSTTGREPAGSHAGCAIARMT